MVATSFGGYASCRRRRRRSGLGDRASRILLVLVMTVLNIVGSTAVARVQAAHRQGRAGDPGALRDRDDRELEPSAARSRRLPGTAADRLERRADVLRVPRLRRHHLHREGSAAARPASCRARCTWRSRSPPPSTSAVALGVFGTLTADQVVEYGATALAEAAKPTLGQAGYVLMVITALFSTAGAVNASLYPVGRHDPPPRRGRPVPACVRPHDRPARARSVSW